MDTTVAPARVQQLRIDGYPPDSDLIFCPDCDFQLPPQTVGPSICPECGDRLLVVKVRKVIAERDTHLRAHAPAAVQAPLKNVP